MKRLSKCAIWTTAGALALALCFTAGAFKPNETDHGHKLITEGVLYKGYAYGGKSVTAYSTKLSDGSVVKFSEEAASHIYFGNKSTDLPTADFKIDGVDVSLDWELTMPVAHCDDEMIDDCAIRIRKLREEVVENLRTYVGNNSNKLLLGMARGKLGKALHTLQDFYAHSNFADIHTGSETFDALTGVIGSGYARAADVTVCEARTPTLSWYALPSWANNGGNWRLMGSGLLPNQYTTGYFGYDSSVGLGSARDTGGVKCDHGNENTISFGVVSGIAKDVPYAPLDDTSLTVKQGRGMPSTIHVRASHQAALHTYKFMDTVLERIKTVEPDKTKQDDMIKALLGVSTDLPVYGFVVDRTGSMNSVIAGVKLQIQKLIDDAVAKGGDASAKKFMLVDYGDPDVSTPVVGTAAQVKTAVGNLYASRGGDCPESTNTALRVAAKAAPKGSSLYVFTDASSNDSSLEAEVLAIASSKKITINYAVSGSCSPIDPTYVRIANATGGQVLEVEHSTAGMTAAFTSISIDAVNQFAQSAVIESGTIAAPKTVSFPVEDGASRLSVLANTATGSVKFYAPTGVEVVASPSATLTDYIGGRGMRVNNPVSGVWSMVITPTSSGAYSVKVDIANTLTVSAPSFYGTQQTGRSGHQGLAEFIDNPPIGSTTVQLTLTGTFDANAKSLRAIGVDGTTLASAELTLSANSIYQSVLTMGDKPFRLQVLGKTAAGKDFIRTLPTLYTPKPFSLELMDVSQWARGATGEMRIKLTNHSTNNNFSVSSGVSTAGSVIEITPKNLALAANATAVLSLKLAPNSSASLADRHLVALNVTNTDGQVQTHNQYFYLSADTDGDGVPDTMEQGPNGTDITYDGNGDGIADYKQNTVISMYSRQLKGYVTLATLAPAKFSAMFAANPPTGYTGDLVLDVFDFKLAVMKAGDTSAVKLFLPTGITASGFAKYGREKDITKAPAWYEYTMDSGTGATVAGNTITLTYVDGKRGDDDLSANGVIANLGGPMKVVVAGVAPPEDSPATSSNAGGGGCTIGNPDQIDFSLLFLLCLAGLVVYQRRRIQRSA